MKTKSVLGATLRRASPVAATTRPTSTKKASSKTAAASAKAPKAGKAATPDPTTTTVRGDVLPTRRGGSKPEGWKPKPRGAGGPKSTIAKTLLGVDRKYMTKQEVAAHIGVSHAQVSIYVKLGKLRQLRLGPTTVRFDPADVKAFMDSCEEVV